MCQVVATIWACFVQIAVMNWTLGNIEDACAQYASCFHFPIIDLIAHDK